MAGTQEQRLPAGESVQSIRPFLMAGSISPIHNIMMHAQGSNTNSAYYDSGASNMIMGDATKFLWIDTNDRQGITTVGASGKMTQTNGAGPCWLTVRNPAGAFRKVYIKKALYLKGFPYTLVSPVQLEELGLVGYVHLRRLVNGATGDVVCNLQACGRVMMIELHLDRTEEAVEEPVSTIDPSDPIEWSAFVKQCTLRMDAQDSKKQPTQTIEQIGYVARSAQDAIHTDARAAQLDHLPSGASVTTRSLPTEKITVVVLFSGMGSVEHVLQDAHPGINFISVDILPAKHLTHQMDIRDFCEDGGPLSKMKTGSVQMLWASPPCNNVSRANTTGIRDLAYVTQMIECIIKVMDHLQPKAWYIENPDGLLKSLPVMQPFASSMLVVSQCHFGMPYRKDTNIWTSEYQVLVQTREIWRCARGSECVYKALTRKHQITAQAGPSKSGRPGAGGSIFTQQIPGKMTLALTSHLPWDLPADRWALDAQFRLALFAEQDDDCRESAMCNIAFRAITASTVNPCSSLSPKGVEDSEQLKLWHQRMAHPNGGAVIRAMKQGIIPDLSGNLTHDQISYVCGTGCEDCAVSKTRRPSFAPKELEDGHGSDRPFGRVGADATGPLPVGIFGGKYNMLFVCFKTGWLYGSIMRTRKDSTRALMCFAKHANAMLRLSDIVLQPNESPIKILQTDNGKEVMKGEFAALCAKMQIVQCSSAPYAHEEQALVERWHGVLMAKTRALLHGSGLHDVLWGFALLYAIYAHNRTPSKRNPGGISPYECMLGKVDPNMRMVVFGCDAYAFEDPAVRKNKLAPTHRKLIVIGVADESTGYLLMDPTRTPPQVVTRSMVRLDEGAFTAAQGLRALLDSQVSSTESALDLMSNIADAPAGLLTTKSETNKAIKRDASILEVRPMLHPTDNEILTIIKCTSKSHLDGVWAMAHQAHQSVGIDLLVSHILSNPLTLAIYSPIYDLYLCKEGPDDASGEPAILIGVDMNTDVRDNKMMLVMGRNDGTWYQADVQTSALVNVSTTEFERRVTEITDLRASLAQVDRNPQFLSVPNVICHDDKGIAVTEPKTRAQMLRGPDAVQWQHSETVEIKKNLDNNTMRMTHLDRRELLAAGYEIISANFVYKVKTELREGVIALTERKARLCAHGNEQVNSYDLYTHAATPPYMVLRMILILAQECGVIAQQADVVSAFQFPELTNHKIVVSLPVRPGLGGDGKRVNAILLKTMQGLKQSSKVWGDTLHSFMMNWDPRITCVEKAGKCLYTIWTGSIKMMCMRWVDDVIGFSSDSNKLFNALLCSMGDKFPLKLLGNVMKCLGTEVTYRSDSIVLTQQKNIKHMVEEYNVLALVPRNPKIPVSADQFSKVVKHDSPQANVPFRNAMGELLWTGHTRPDIAYHVQRLASLCNGYDEYSFSLLLQIIKYLHCTIDKGVVLRRSGMPLERLTLFAYSDASHASDPINGRSVSGSIVFLQDNPVDWSSRPQKTVAVSTVESELMGATECVKDVMLQRHLLSEFAQVNDSTRIHLDSEGATFIASTDKTSANTRHIAVRHFYCREKVKTGEIIFGHVDGIDNPADMLTKPLERVKLEQYATVLMDSITKP